MTEEVIELGDVTVDVTRKDVKNVHLSVHPPDGRVTLVTPQTTRTEVARAFVATKLGWIRDQRNKLQDQAREDPRRLVGRESHQLWGRQHLLEIVEVDGKPFVTLDHRTIWLHVRTGSDTAERAKIMHRWHLSLLHEAVPSLIRKWEDLFGVSVCHYFLQRMKTKWGSCNQIDQSIRLNTELVKKPKDLLEYVVVHEIAHLIEPSHNKHFFELLDRHYPAWPEARKELNELPLSAEQWNR